MKNMHFGLWLVAACFLGVRAFGATYYVNDDSQEGDVYTTATGNDVNSGTTSNAPLRTWGGVTNKNLVAGDTIYMDTGTYEGLVTINVSGTVDSPIHLIGSPNGTILRPDNPYRVIYLRGMRYWDFQNLILEGNCREAITIENGYNNQFSRISIRVISTYGIRLTGASSSNRLEHCEILGWGTRGIDNPGNGIRDNELLNSVVVGNQGSAFFLGDTNQFSRLEGCIIDGPSALFDTTNFISHATRNIIRVSTVSPAYATLSALQVANTNWTFNTSADPLFVDTTNKNFHLSSPAGCISNQLSASGYVTNRVWVTDSALLYSPAIDFGAKDMVYANEPAPNGGRANIGLYGGTAEASKSRASTQKHLFAMSFNDGGNITNTCRLEWLALNFGANEKVKLGFSRDAGDSWVDIATVAATNEAYLWAPASEQQSPTALWRVTSVTTPAVASTNAKPFGVRTRADAVFTYFVNDASTNGDIYCTAMGNDANLGSTSNRPKQSLQAILDAYDLEPGDAVYVDTGMYGDATVTFQSADSGISETQRVHFVGSPRGTVFARSNTTYDVFVFENGAQHILLENVVLQEGRSGVNISGSSDILFSRVSFRNNQYGINDQGGSSWIARGAQMVKNTGSGVYCRYASSTNCIENSVFWDNSTAVHSQSNALRISDSVLGKSATLFGNQVVSGDYNVIWENSAWGASCTKLEDVQEIGNEWSRSFVANPLFADADQMDFHPKSIAGRFQPTTGTFVIDAVHSPLIDAGNPAILSYTNEVSPNGARLNVGLFGGTPEASKSLTNAWLQVLSFNDGGTLDAQLGETLRWNSGNCSTSSTVTLWLSRDDGFTWEVLTNGLSAQTGECFYQNTDTNDSSALYAQWKVTLDNATNVSSTCATNFSYKNGAYVFFVNDDSLLGDVYCTAVGDDGNAGVSRGAPMASISALLERYTLGAGDRVYIDTGVYSSFRATTFTQADSGGATNPISFVGSTNVAAGGSQFGSRSIVSPNVFVFQNGVSNIVMQNMLLTNVTTGIAMNMARNISFENLSIRGIRGQGMLVQTNSSGIAIRHSAFHGGGVGISYVSGTNIVLEHTVFYGLTNSVVLSANAQVSMMHNVFSSDLGGGSLISYTTLDYVHSDYNGLNAAGNARLSENRQTGQKTDNLAAWQKLSGMDAHSISGDPLMADPDSFDYHLQTAQTLGRFTTNGWMADVVSSPLLDAGDPSASVGAEPLSNGGRVNIGRYGGTIEASKALTTPWLCAISFSDAGGVTNGVVPLRWIAGGGIAGTVCIDVSRDGGVSWQNVDSGIPATNEVFEWTLTGMDDSPATVWRITSEADARVTSQSSVFFAIRNRPLKVYVATADTNENVYVSVPGKNTNYEASSNAPLNSLRTALTLFDLEGGDTIYVDSGLYEEESTVVLGLKDSGTSNQIMRIVGNTIDSFHGSVIKQKYRTTGLYGLNLSWAEHVTLDSLCISNAWTAAYVQQCTGVTIEHSQLGYAATNVLWADTGTDMTLTSCLIQQSLYNGVHVRTGAVVNVVNSLFRDNRLSNLRMSGGNLNAQNNVLQATGQGRYVFMGNATARCSSDYNNVVVKNGAAVAGGFGEASARFLIDWQSQSGGSNDMHSFGYDPEFANEEADDFHPLSADGRFVPVMGIFTNDVTTSKLIDMGNPEHDYSRETTNNGGRINVGVYGNTVEASHSSTNGSLVPLTMSDGGTLRGTATLYWHYNGFVGNEQVNILFSDNGGVTWDYTLASNVYMNADGYVWNTTNYPSTAMGAWKVVLANDSNVYGQTETLFAVKNEPANYYVNDASTNGDVYCTTEGSGNFDGLSPETPLNSLETLLGRYKVEPGDTVYVDTGFYVRTGPMVVSVFSPGATNRLVIQGSTNEPAGGSVFSNSLSGAVIELSGSQQIELRNLRLCGGDTGVLLTESSSNVFYHVQSERAKNFGFCLGEKSDQNLFIQCSALSASQTGFCVRPPINTLVSPTTNYWQGGVLSSPFMSNGIPVSTGKLVSVQKGCLYVSNSVFAVNQTSFDVYDVGQGSLVGDYNFYCLPFSESRLVRVALGTAFGVTEASFSDLTAWTEWSGCDSNSLSGDPQFADLENGDLHPLSEGGRISLATGELVFDTTTSPLLDTGDLQAPFADEPTPNGGRLNMGIYGNHALASLTPTNKARYVLRSLNDGGVVSGQTALLWIPCGVATNQNHLVVLSVSSNSGASYSTVANNVRASDGRYVWDAASWTSCPTMRWRIQSQTNLSWAQESSSDFILKNGPLVYYVNDLSTEGDVYCSAIGAATNNGTVASQPLNSLQAVLDRFNLEPGDTVYIDSGIYVQDNPVLLDYRASGNETNPVVLQGSTNTITNRTIWRGAGMQLKNIHGIEVNDFAFQEQVALKHVLDIQYSGKVSFNAVDLINGRWSGVFVQYSSNIVFEKFSVSQMATNGIAGYATKGLFLSSGVLEANQSAILVNNHAQFMSYLYANESFYCVSNCALRAKGYRTPALEVRGTLYSDYNNYYLQDNALVAISYLSGRIKEYNSVGTWVAETGADVHSLSHNPLFLDAESGDFRLQSIADGNEQSSPLIDAGNPASPFVMEPIPNGGRLNIGRYGNTTMAAQTATNSVLTLISFHDGGRASGTNALITWNFGGGTNEETLTIWYSANGGVTWIQLATNLPAHNGAWTWNTEASEPSVQAKLRLESSGGAIAETDGYFSVRNQAVSFYVNDTSPTGDIYCTSIGHATNSGLAPSSPMLDLNRLLETYDLEAGDIVYIDTGLYDSGINPWRITQSDSAGMDEDGLVNEPPVIFQGSTNSLLNGTVLGRNGQAVGIQVDYAAGVELRNITVSNTSEHAVLLNDSYAVLLEWVAANNANIGFCLSGGSQLAVKHSVVVNSQHGIHIEGRDVTTTNTIICPVIENNVLWNLFGYAIYIAAKNIASAQNNLMSVVDGYYVYGLGRDATLTTDYNSIVLQPGARVYEQTQDPAVSPVPIVYETLGVWAAASGQDLHSYDGEPKLADARQFDFHLLSQGGRYTNGGVWVEDEETSPLIDAGSPSSVWTNEPAPNGGCINIGLYGGTPEASKIPTNALVRLLTLNRGGVASGMVNLNWLATGVATDYVFDIEFSSDGGTTWDVIASGIEARLGGIRWNSVAESSSPVCRWRLRDAVTSTIWGTSEQPFVLHNGSISYYVNDSYTNHDVYCTVPGDSSQTGYAPNAPKRWVAEILDTYNLEPGDVIYLDTGSYQLTEELRWGDLDAGCLTHDESQHVILQGSTNIQQGGSRFLLSSEQMSGLHFTNTYGITVSHLSANGGGSVVDMDRSYFIHGNWLQIQNASNAVYANMSSNVLITHSLFQNNHTGLRTDGRQAGSMHFDQGVLWSNQYALYVNYGSVTLSNSIACALMPGAFVYYMHSDHEQTHLSGDYNSLYLKGGGQVAGYQTGASTAARTSVYASVSTWMAATGNDPHSLPYDPLFADVRTGDFHLKSAGGRLQYNEDGLQTWVYDTVSSPLIDAANPQDRAWTEESDPNGRRLNIGMYGGTREASRSDTEGWIILLSLNDGGSASGEVPLLWSVGGAATNFTVCLDYSPDNGLTWTNIVCGVPASEGQYVWSSEPYGRSALGRWRAYCVERESILASSLAPFVLRNGGSIYYYVNDVQTTNDMYCTAIGDDANDGLTPATPKPSIQAILDAYELEPEDIVLVDAGTYSSGTPILIEQSDSGWTNEYGVAFYVTIQGSTNPLAPSILMTPSLSSDSVLNFEYAEYVRLKDFTIRYAASGVSMNHAIGCELKNVRIQNNNSYGMNVYYSSGIAVENGILWNNSSRTGGVAVAISQGDLRLLNCVLWDSSTSVEIGNGGQLSMTNCVAYAQGSAGRIFTFSMAAALNAFSGDYNCYYCTNGALLAEKVLETGGSDYFNTLPTWNAATGNDVHTLLNWPNFVSAGTGDFHLMSRYGYYPDWQVNLDRTNSVLLDVGCPSSIWTNEPNPNGGIINIGAYGNTAQASLSDTSKWVRAISYNEGGTMSGSVLLYWTYGGLESDVKIQLDYSVDYESTWVNIASNIPVGRREYPWDVTRMPLCQALYWRVQVQDETGIADAIDVPVKVKTHSYDYFINDGSTEGDVYCRAPGQSSYFATGTNAASPYSSLAELLLMYPVGAGDRIFIDTGTYELTNAVVWTDQQMGAQGEPLKIYGSTNWAAGGSLFVGNERRHDGFQMQNTRYLELSDIRFSMMRDGLALSYSDNVLLKGIDTFNNRSNGISASSCGLLELSNILAYNNGRFGYSSEGQKGSNLVRNATFWNNEAGAVRNTIGTMLLENSILMQTNTEAICFVDGSGNIQGDYNLFAMPEDGLIAKNTDLQTGYSTLSQWINGPNNMNSWVGDPLFVDPESGNFHMLSRAGWWSNGTWAVSSNTSWAIDAGNPNDDFSSEPEPRGTRINLGRYGGTERASKTDVHQRELFPVSLRDGGIAPYGQVLVWLSRGLADTNRVRIQYAPDGMNWKTVDEVGILQCPYVWLSTDAPSPEALWRVVLVGDDSVIGATDETFIFRPTPLTYYVNDASTNGDVYTTAVGSATNRGYSPESPLAGIQLVLDRYQLSGGDSILLDTGSYELTNTITLTSIHRGTADANIRIQGSTNQAAAGSWIRPTEGMDTEAFLLYGTSYIELSDLHIAGFSNGVAMAQETRNCTLSDLDVVNSKSAGVALNRTLRATLNRVLVRDGLTNGVALSSANMIVLNGCVIWSNLASSIFVSSGDVTLSNCVVESTGFGNYCYESPTNVSIVADYNNLFIQENAQIASIDGMQYEKLPQWVKGKRQDAHSLSTVPLFHDPANGDFHLRSVAGRYDPELGWVTDAPEAGMDDFSPMIDMGGLVDAWTNETAPNGSRRNIGLYGGTPQASRSNTNAWLLATTAMSGGLTYGTFYLVWGYGGAIQANEDVMLSYSYDNGTSWQLIGNAKAGDRQYFWESTQLQAGSFRWPTSPNARWRIQLTSNTNVWDMIDMRFGLRNSPFTYYLNDLSLEGDIYTHAVGDDDNLGSYPEAPRLTLQALLEAEDLEETDEVYIDTGLYELADTNHAIVWAAADSGTEGNPVVVRGSPNGSRFVASNEFTAGYIFSSEANWLDMQNITLAGGPVEFLGERVSVSNLVVSNATLDILSMGSMFRDTDVYRGNVILSGNSNTLSGLEQRWGQLSLTGTNLSVINSLVYTTNVMATGVSVRASSAVFSNNTVVATKGTALSKQGAGTLRMAHNILVAGGTRGGSVIEWLDGGLISDWNDLVARDTAWVGSRNGKWEHLSYWQTASGQDPHSVSFEPEFQNETQGDFHLNSKTGRWRNGGWTVDASHSPVIDLGNTWTGTGLEPRPNGDRRNLGAYGGTVQASKSLTNLWITALTLNDGGVAKGTNVILKWAAGGYAGDETVTIAYSANGGTVWSNIASGVSLITTSGGGEWTWNSSAVANSFNALWRVTVDESSHVSDTSDTSFELRNRPQNFYLNDASTDGDIYCSAVGSDANSGISSAHPKATLQALLDAYDLEGGDVVYMDTGSYTSDTAIQIIWSRSGDETHTVKFIGNTNVLGGTMFGVTARTNQVFDVKASNFEFRNFGVGAAEYGILLQTNLNVTLSGLQFQGTGCGVSALATTNLLLCNSVFWNTGIGVDLAYARDSVMENLTFALPTNAAIKLTSLVGTDNMIWNNIFIPAMDAVVYDIGVATSILANAEIDYNLYDFGLNEAGEPSTWFFDGAPEDLRNWQLTMNNDYRSAITNAALKTVGPWELDVHPLSEAGRYESGNWVLDAETSWAVDHGNAYEDVGDEPLANGARRNIGAYGGTVQASKGGMEDEYDLRTLDGERQTLMTADPLWPLIWSAELLGTNEDVIVWFTSTGTNTTGWLELARTDAWSEYYVWNISDERFLTGTGRWLITDVNSNVLVISDSDITITRENLHISKSPYDVNGLMRFEWRGGLGGQHYWIMYSDDFGKSWSLWERRYNGPAKIHKSDFTLSAGETLSLFEDRTSYEHRTRWYTITTNDPTLMMTNGIYVP